MSKNPPRELALILSEIMREVETERRWYSDFHIDNGAHVLIEDYVTSHGLVSRLRELLALIEARPGLIVEDPYQHYKQIAYDRAQIAGSNE